MNDNHILGESNRRKIYDPSLASKLNKDAEKEPDRIRTNPEFISDNGKYILLKNISCTDADGKVFEHYDKLWVAQDVVRTQEHYPPPHQAFQQHKNFSTPGIYYDMLNNSALHFETYGAFLPSFALTCNILEAMYIKVGGSLGSAFTNQYFNRGDGFGDHLQNTIIDWGNQKILHYPKMYMSPGKGYYPNRASQQVVYPIELSKTLELEIVWLSELLRDNDYLRFIKNLTGLKKPEILSDVVNTYSLTHHKTELVLAVPYKSESQNYTAFTTIGCDSQIERAKFHSKLFSLSTSRPISQNINPASRGVRLTAPDGDAK